MLAVQGLSVRLGGKDIVQDVSFDLQPGDWLMLVGPNGAGKSTLLNAVVQGLPYLGKVTFAGEDVQRMRPRDRARCIGLLSQRARSGYAFTAEEVISLGRYARSGFLSRAGAGDEGAVRRAAQALGVAGLLQQSVLTLSGGELQRVFLAQLLCQEPQVLLLDEPTNHLDLPYQKQVFSLIGEWLKAPGRAVISVAHDLSLARKYGTQALLLHQGRILAQGDIASTLNTQNLQIAYTMDVPAWMRELLSTWEESE